MKGHERKRKYRAKRKSKLVLSSFSSIADDKCSQVAQKASDTDALKTQHAKKTASKKKHSHRPGKK